jgi:hypothetical protein
MIPPPPPKPDEPGVLEDLVDIFASPAKVFARRAKSGSAAAFFIVAIALAAVIYSGKNVMEPIMDAQMSKAQAAAQKANPNITAEQLQAMQSIGRTMGTVSLVAGAPVALFFLGLFVWAVGKAFGAAITFSSGMMIASFAYVPRIIGGIITDVQGLMMSDVSHLVNPSQLSFGPARFFDPVATNQVLLAVLTRFDLLTIWVTVLIGVGYAAAGKLSRERATIAAVVMWLVGSIFPLWGALRGG